MSQQGQAVGRLQIAGFPNPGDFVKQGANYFRAANPEVQAGAAQGAAIEQGKLESSNSGTAESAVRLVSVMRQFEMLQKAVSLGEDMNRQANRAGRKSGVERRSPKP